MTDPDLIGLFVEPLEAIGISYMVTGGVASDFYVPPIEALEEETARPEGGHFNVIHRETALRADVYLAGDDPLVAWAFARRVRLPVGAAEIWIAPIEYVILRKLEYYEQSGSDRHLRDVAMMLRISGETVDSEAMAEWCERLHLQDTLDRAHRHSPD